MNEKSYIPGKQLAMGNKCIIKFYVDRDYKIPDAIIKSDITQMQMAFDFSARLLDLRDSISDDYIKNTVYQDQIKIVEEEYTKQLAQFEKKSSEEFSSKLSTILEDTSAKQKAFDSNISSIKSEYESKIKDMLKQMKKAEDEATATKADLESDLQKEIKALKKQIEEKQSNIERLSRGEASVREQCNTQSAKLIEVIEEKNKQMLDAVKKSYEQTVEIKEEALKQRELRIIQKEQELQTSIQRNSSSVLRGQDGEKYFSELAMSKMNWVLENTSKIKHSCDYSGIIHKVPVFFEVKNYTADVTQKEITKFLRDMKENPDVLVGIFISLNRRIVNKNKDVPISIEWINDSQCAVYIQSFKELDEDHTLSMIDQLIKLSSTYNKLIASKGYLSQESMLQERIDKARVYIEEYTTESCSLINRVTNDQKILKKHIESTFSHTLAELRKHYTCINTVLEIITGEYKEDTNIDETLIEDETSTPKKQQKKKSSGLKK